MAYEAVNILPEMRCPLCEFSLCLVLCKPLLLISYTTLLSLHSRLLHCWRRRPTIVLWQQPTATRGRLEATVCSAWNWVARTSWQGNTAKVREQTKDKLSDKNMLTAEHCQGKGTNQRSMKSYINGIIVVRRKEVWISWFVLGEKKSESPGLC